MCERYFLTNAANVVCRRLGFPGALSVRKDFPDMHGQIWLDNVRCIGNETGLEQCSHLGFGNQPPSCAYFGNVGVTCIGMFLYRNITGSSGCIVSINCDHVCHRCSKIVCSTTYIRS